MSAMYSAKSPYCEHTLDPSTAVDGWVTCPCGRRSDVQWVSELGWLQARGEFVGKQVSDGTAWYDTTRGTAASQTSAAPKPASGQNVLYVLGALSLVTAFVVFTAVAWTSIGAIGQGAVLIGGSLFSAFIAIKTRVRMIGLANTFAFISTAVAGVFLFNAPSVGLFPEAWNRVEDGYPVIVLLALSLVSGFLGFRLKIAGWTYVPSVAALPIWVMVSQVIVRDHLGEEAVLAASVFTGFLVLVALEYLTERLLEANPQWRFGAVVNFIVQVTVTWAVATFSIPNVAMGSRPYIDAGAFFVAGFGFLAVYQYWTRPPELKFYFSALRWSSLILAALALGLASAWVFAPSWSFDTYSDNRGSLWVQLLPAAALGAAAFLISAFVERINTRHRIFFTVYGVTVWLFGYFFLTTQLFNDDHGWELFTYFSVIASTSMVCWLKSRNIIQFIAATASGSFAVAVLISTTYTNRIDGPEPFSFAIAAWLLFCMLVLRSREAHLNTAVWLGIPYATVLLPSSAYAVAAVANDASLTLNWIRLWTVLVASLAGTILGANFRVAGWLWPSAVAYVLATFPQLFVDLNLVVPRWVFFAILGVLLILTAARFERLQQLRRESGSWSEVFR